MLDFHVFILACPTKLQNYKHINFQFARIASYKLQNYNLGYRPMTKFAKSKHLQINNYKFTFDKLQMHVCKFTSLQVCKITKLPITKYKVTKLQIASL